MCGKHQESSTGCVGHFRWYGWGPLDPLAVRVTANHYNVVLSDHFYMIMKHFDPDGSGVFQDDSASIHRAQGVTV